MTRRDLTAADVLDAWRIGDPAPPHLRLARLMAVFVPGETLRTDTLGARNQRVIRLGRALLGDALEARLTCLSCGTEIEFAVPEDAILSASVPDPDTVVAVTVDGQVHRFRVPTMADLDAAVDALDLTRRCALDDTPFPEAGLPALEAAFASHDPAGDIRIDTACPECGAETEASVEPAGFVAAGIDRLYRALLTEVDCLARVYGWTEGEVLSLPTDRRRAYVAMVTARAAQARVPGRRVLG
ncbi:hypothetical protein [Maritimibacter alexandrii]|uniref:hypothetical protein n=1 Tax=Maritimibacter alexandrii TaxID=2570355 RepID=UPI001107C5B7|nr:hypothetical protein [Maritimibacter alexandrii]